MRDGAECYCKCHNTTGMVHVVPCCAWCRYCQRKIKMWLFEDHIADELKAIAEETP